MVAALLLILSAFLHAGWNTLTKLSDTKDAFIFWTLLLSCAMVGLVLLVGPQPWELGDGPGFWLAVGAGVFEGFYLISMARALDRLPLAQAYPVMRGGAMVLVWMFSLIAGREAMSPLSLLGTFLVFMGIQVSGWGGAQTRSAYLNDLMWPSLAAGCIAGYHVFYDEALRFNADPLALFVVALLVSLPFIWVPRRARFAADSRDLLASSKAKLLAAAAAASLGFVGFLYGMKWSGPGYAITLRNTSIFFSVGFSFLIRENVSRFQIAGALLVGLGAFILGLA
ncbi:MAG TPA: DMT family transporter [Bdellovibrionales bacterium]|nr:DMT family transporter [Bdellovibrionales bacterium]